MGRQILADAPMNQQEIVPRLTWNSVPDNGFSSSLYFKSIILKNLDGFLDARPGLYLATKMQSSILKKQAFGTKKYDYLLLSIYIRFWTSLFLGPFL